MSNSKVLRNGVKTSQTWIQVSPYKYHQFTIYMQEEGVGFAAKSVLWYLFNDDDEEADVNYIIGCSCELAVNQAALRPTHFYR
jgi:hypothetical protein